MSTQVENRSNSPFSRTTAADCETGMPSSSSDRKPAALRSFESLAKALMKQTAAASHPLSRIRSASRARAAVSSSASTVPSAAVRSSTSSRRSLGTSGLGRWNLMSNSPPISRRVRPISMVSRNPSVVTSAVFAPLRSSSVLVAIVVPCTKTSIAPVSMPSSPSAFSTPRHWRPGSEGTFAGKQILGLRVEAEDVRERPPHIDPDAVSGRRFGHVRLFWLLSWKARAAGYSISRISRPGARESGEPACGAGSIPGRSGGA